MAPQAGLSFAGALRSILRQDPDVILVGEIRDAETLDVSMKASLTGHLVLSTLHTNDATATVTRLLDMAPAYLVASTLEMVAAQRLLRKLCSECKRSDVARDVGVAFVPVGCPSCRGSGYSGRVPVIEVMVVDEGLRALIRASADPDALRRHAVEHCGMKTMHVAARELVAAGLTSLEEVMRVVG